MKTILRITLIYLLLLTAQNATAAPPQTTHFIKVDQFGYLPDSRKVAVITDPQVGYNAAESFNPGTAPNAYQVRRWQDDVVVFSGTLQAWNNGETHTQSGDKGWWFDFSVVTTPGSYYVFDVTNNTGSFAFDISPTVYDEVLKQAMRTYYYQRINFAKQAPYTDPKWSDGAWFEGANQDRFATSRFAKGNMATAKDLHGGWMDAGDLNKYVTFAASAVIQLVETYRINPKVFKDNYNIPESGNGIPDILDEVRWELDFLKRMQDATGTNGFFLKVGVDNYNEVSPPSKDTRARYYLPECTSSTIFGSATFAAAGVIYKNEPALSAYGADLVNRAELAWARAKVTTSNFTTFQTNCDDGDIKSGDSDRTAEQQLDYAFVAAVYLYEATGKSEYKTFAETNYTKVNPYKISWWGPYYIPQQLALLRLTTLPSISATVITNIRNQKARMENLYSIPVYTAGTDLYRAHLNDEAYHWGHNEARADAGTTNLDYVTFNLNPTRHSQYREVAEQYLHWMHGVNPMGMVMLSNMYNYGAERSVNEIFHRWYKDGSVWDNALTSANGPAPGYVPGGPNKSYAGSLGTMITGQPTQKAYKDWNTDWPENSYEITEPAIYYQASYVMLLSRLMVADNAPADVSNPSAPLQLIASNITENSLDLSWTASTDDVGVTGYEVYQNGLLVKTLAAVTSVRLTDLTCATSYTYTVRAKDAAGNRSDASSTTAVTPSCLTIGNAMVYDDALQAHWQDVSLASVRNYNYTSLVKAGSKSIKVDFAGNGTLGFSTTQAVITTPTSQLRFWVNDNSRNGIKVFTESDGGVKSPDIAIKTGRNKWVEVIISMSQLGNPANIQKIIIQNDGAATATMYFDEVQLTHVVADTAPIGTSHASPVRSGNRSFISESDIYPNPAKQHLTISVNLQAETFATISLFDVTGRVIMQHGKELEAGLNNWQLTLPVMHPGIYFVKFTSKEQTFTRAIVIQ